MLRGAGRFARQGVDKTVDGIAGGKLHIRFVVPDFVRDAHPYLRHVLKRGPHDDEIVIPGGPHVRGMRFDHRKKISHPLDFRIGQADLPEQIGPALFEILKEFSVVDHFHLVGIGVADADFCFSGKRHRNHSSYSPIFENFSIRRSMSLSVLNFCSFFSSSRSVSFRISPACCGLRCAPPSGSGTIRSIIPCARRSGAVSFNASAACSLKSQLLQRILEQDSGEMTEYQVCSSMRMRSPMPMPSAPPDAPSPMITTMIGTGRWDISKRFRAIASAWPRSSASRPG